MKRFAKKITISFGSGCVGSLVASLALWLAGFYGITEVLGVTMAPAISVKWLYPRVVWGGLWGFLFVLPVFSKSIVRRGVVLSLGPTLFQLFVFYPHLAGKGIMGLGLGALTPLFVFVFNAVWGISTALWVRFAGEEVLSNR